MSSEHFELHEALEKAIQNYLNGNTSNDVALPETLDFTIRISGDTWNGEFVDARIASYVLKVQRIVQDVLKKNFPHETDKEEMPLIRVKLSKGSVNLLVKVVEFFKPYIDKMTSTQQFIIVLVTIAGLSGYLINGQRISYLEFTQKNQINENADIRKDKFIESAMEIAQKAADANKVLITKLKYGDEIEFSSIRKTYSSKDAKKMFPRNPKSKLSSGFADTLCKITSIDFKNDTMVLLIGNEELKAQTMLSIEDRRSFYDEIKNAKKTKGDLPEFHLNIDILYNKYGIKTATIVGIGDPRHGAKELSFFKQNKKKESSPL